MQIKTCYLLKESVDGSDGFHEKTELLFDNIEDCQAQVEDQQRKWCYPESTRYSYECFVIRKVEFDA